MSQFAGLLLDSDVLAEIRKAEPAPQVVAYLRRNSYKVLYVSVLSLGELKGLFPYAETDRWLAELVDRFGNHVLEIDEKISLQWAGRHAERALHAIGSPATAPLATAALEGLICATAQVHQLEIASSKAEVYKRWGVAAVNPFIEG
ncbi:MAG: plasmid stabilization protein [Rothia sp. (in: high G+C Gram-positive bacteria)]|nr:plasmid stabilization protein [Rothia sp. (in: high G+C Gram-positive bacteria)]